MCVDVRDLQEDLGFAYFSFGLLVIITEKMIGCIQDLVCSYVWGSLHAELLEPFRG